ncbi:hypothetical protein FACS1894188_04270 [Clostridia bacterium]|nr:hypothetical protein FACS1894188_04270 [Clostridia bacterium]
MARMVIGSSCTDKHTVIVGICISQIVLLVAVVVLSNIYFKTASAEKMFENALEVTATVLDSGISLRDELDATKTIYWSRYEYTIDGNTYTSSKSLGRKRYSIGDEVLVYYAPG